MSTGFVQKTNKDEILQEVKQKNAQALTDKITANTTLYGNNAKTITDNYTAQIDEANKSYDDEYRENAVQKKVNEFYIAEEMANMGLSNSGLNRTQLTANQLSYSNNKAKIDMQRQSMVDKLTLEMQGYLTENENQRVSSEQSIRDAHDQADLAEATESYNTQLQAEVDTYNAEQDRLAREVEAKTKEAIELAEQARLAKEAEIKAQNEYQLAIEKANISAAAEVQKQAIKSSYSSSKKSSDNKNDEDESKDDIYHFSRIETDSEHNEVVVYQYNGKEVKVAKGLNPYTRTKAPGASKYDTFDNGYQPKGVVYNGTDMGKIVGYTGTDGNTGQKIWYLKDGSTWLWNGNKNTYEPYKPFDGFSSSDFESYFANIRQTDGKAEAKAELEEAQKYGWIPANMVMYAQAGVNGKYGH